MSFGGAHVSNRRSVSIPMTDRWRHWTETGPRANLFCDLRTASRNLSAPVSISSIYPRSWWFIS